jgi:3-phenylpropionate/trans-cinnamate dioxygenase ferredoxin reductase subunit
MARGMVIVGGGECGGRAALELRSLGYDGPVTLVASEPHVPYERPPLSKRAIADPFEPTIVPLASAEVFDEGRIALFRGTPVVRIDRPHRHVELSDGRTIEFDRVLLATGSSPRPLSSEGNDRVLALRTIEDAAELHRRLDVGTRLGIIGGGLIGMEVAASAATRGAQVTVIEAFPRVLSRGVPAEIAEIVAARHERAGVAIICADPFESVAASGDGLMISLTSGRLVEVDIVLVAIGVVPATQLARDAELEVEDGIVVDDHLVTSDPDIFAAGDCCSFPLARYGGRRVRLESWRNACEQGVLAARNMLDEDETLSTIPWFWSEQYELRLEVVGLPDEASTTVRRDVGDGSCLLFHVDSEARLAAATSIGVGSSLARQSRLAERLIESEARPAWDALADPTFDLKRLLTTCEPSAAAG